MNRAPLRSSPSRMFSVPRVALGLACVGVLSACSTGPWVKHYPVTGAIKAYYESPGIKDELEDATSDEHCGLPRGGCYQEFEGGTIFWSPSVGTAHVLDGDILTFLTDAQGPKGTYGYPTRPVQHDDATDSDYLETYNPEQKKRYWLVDSGDGVRPVQTSGGIGSYWKQHRTDLGVPTTDRDNDEQTAGAEVCSATPVCHQDFEHGEVFWSAQHGLAPVPEQFRDAHDPSMGYALGAAYQTADALTIQSFAPEGRDSLRYVMSMAEGAEEPTVRKVEGAIAKTYLKKGAEHGPLGIPLSDTEDGLAGAGAWQRFGNGRIYWSPKTGSHAIVTTDITDSWDRQGREKGPWGYPTSDERTVGGFTEQDFQGGTVRVSRNGMLVFLPTPALSKDPRTIFDATAKQYGFSGSGKPATMPDGTQYSVYNGGVVMLVRGVGVVPMSTEVFNVWDAQANHLGLPLMAREQEDHLETQFTRTALAYYPEKGGLVLRTNQALDSRNVLVIGDSQLVDGNHDASWVSQALRSYGYIPYYEAKGGIGVVADHSLNGYGSYYDGVVDQRWILPSGEPGLIYIQGSGNDSYGTPASEIHDNMTDVILQLRSTYPNSRIVLTGLISTSDATARNRTSDILQQVASEQGITFIPLRGKITEWDAAQYLKKDGLHFRVPEGQNYMAGKYAPYLRSYLDQ